MKEAAARRVHQPDFVVLDSVMPRHGGAGAVDILRSPAPSSTIVAFSTALETRPVWADAFLNRDRIGEVALLLTAMIPGTSSKERAGTLTWWRG